MSVSEFHLHMRSLLELTQTGTVAEYTAMFWEHLHRVLHLNSTLSIKCFVPQYINGLCEDIQAAVRSRSPSSITGASCLARIREDEMVKEAAMAAKKLDDGCGHGIHGITPTEILTDAFPELTTLVECGADHGFSTIDVNNLAAPTLTRCLTECPSRNATVNIFPELAYPAVHDEALDIETVHATAPTPAIWSTGDLAHGNDDEKLVPFPVMRLFSTPEVGPPTFTAVLVSTNANEITAHQFMPDVTPGWTPQGKVVRPAPWPSFLDEGTSTDCGDIIESPPSVTTVSTRAVAPYMIWQEIILVDNDHSKEYQVDLVFGPQPEFKAITPQPLGQPGEIGNWNNVADHAGTKADEQCGFIRLPTRDSLFTNREVPDASSPIRVQSDRYPHSYSEGSTSRNLPQSIHHGKQLPFISYSNPVMSLVAFCASAMGPRISTSCTSAAMSISTRAYNSRIISESMRANNMAHDVRRWLLIMGNICNCVRAPHMFESVNNFFAAGETRVALYSLTLDVLLIASYLGTVGSGACLQEMMLVDIYHKKVCREELSCFPRPDSCTTIPQPPMQARIICGLAFLGYENGTSWLWIGNHFICIHMAPCLFEFLFEEAANSTEDFNIHQDGVTGTRCSSCALFAGSRERKLRWLFSAILLEVSSEKQEGIGYFLQRSHREKNLNSIRAASDQAMRLCYVELRPWTYSVLHFIETCTSELGIQRYGANGRLIPEVACSTTNTVLLACDTTQLRSWPQTPDGTEYVGTFQYNTTGMICFPFLINQVPLLWKSPWPPPKQEHTSGGVEVNHDSKSFVALGFDHLQEPHKGNYNMIQGTAIYCWRDCVQPTSSASPKCFGEGSTGRFYLQFPVFLQTTRIEIYSPWIQCSPFRWWFLSATRESHEWTPRTTMFSCIYNHVHMFIAWLSYEMNRQPQAKETVQHYIGWFRGIMYVYKMSHTSVAAPFGDEILLCSSERTICKHMILPYDPGGPALQLDKIGGIHESRFIIIGLRASRISREGECNTPTMGCQPMFATWAWATSWADQWRLSPIATYAIGRARKEDRTDRNVFSFSSSCSRPHPFCFLYLTSPCC